MLAEEGSLPVDQKLVEELVEGVAVEGKVSPADIGISLLVLSELAGGRPAGSLSLDDFRESGGQAGLLTRYLEKLLELFPEAERPEVLRGLLSLVDLEKDQRLAEGRTLAEVEESIKPASPPRFAAALRFLASGKARVLEELSGEPARFRLVHERLIPAIRKLTGVLLAEAERASLALERGYRVWVQDRQSRFLLHRKDLKEVRRFKNQIRWGKEEVDKREFVRLSWRRETWRKLAMVAAAVAAFSIVIGIGEFTRKREYQSLLATWGLPPDLYDRLGQVEELTLPGTVTRLDWLSSARRLKKLIIEDGLLESLEGLPSGVETLVLGESRLSDLRGLPAGLTSLTLGGNRIDWIKALPSGLRFLNLDLRKDPLFDLNALPSSLSELRLVIPAGLEKPDFRKVGSLQALTLHAPRGATLAPNSLPAGLRSLALKGVHVSSFEEIPRGVRSLSYTSNDSILVVGQRSFAGLPETLESLELEAGGTDSLVLAKEVHQLPTLRSLRINLKGIGLMDIDSFPRPLTFLEIVARQDGTGLNGIRVQSLPKMLESASFTCEWILLQNDLPLGIKSLKVNAWALFKGSSEDWQRLRRSTPSIDLPKPAQFSLPPDLVSLYIASVPPHMKLPPSLSRLKTPLTLPSYALPLPEGLQSLDMSWDFSSGRSLRLPRLPDGLTELNLRNTGVQKLPGNLRRLARLDITDTLIDTLDDLPERLESLSLSVRQVEALEGLPASVTALHFHGASAPVR